MTWLDVLATAKNGRARIMNSLGFFAELEERRRGVETRRDRTYYRGIKRKVIQNRVTGS